MLYIKHPRWNNSIVFIFTIYCLLRNTTDIPRQRVSRKHVMYTHASLSDSKRLSHKYINTPLDTREYHVLIGIMTCISNHTKKKQLDALTHYVVTSMVVLLNRR